MTEEQASVRISVPNEDGECPVCLLSANVDLIACLPCQHLICKGCAIKLVNLPWIREVTCPLCRVKIEGFSIEVTKSIATIVKVFQCFS